MEPQDEVQVLVARMVEIRKQVSEMIDLLPEFPEGEETA